MRCSKIDKYMTEEKNSQEISKPPITSENPNRLGSFGSIFRHKNFWWVVSLVVLAFFGMAGGYYYGHRSNPSADYTVPGGVSVDTGSTTTPANMDVEPRTVYEPNKLLDWHDANLDYSLPSIVSGEIKWNTPKKTEGLDVFKLKPGVSLDSPNYYLVGEFVTGRFAGGELYLVFAGCEGLCEYQRYYLVKRGQEYYFLEKDSSALDTYTYNVPSVHFQQIVDYQIADLNLPEFIDGPKPGTRLKLISKRAFAPILFFNAESMRPNVKNLEQFYRSPVVGVVYKEKTSELNGYYVVRADGTRAEYTVEIPFIGKDNVPLVTWSDGARVKTEYSYQTIGGCGGTNFVALAADTDSISKLQVAGRTFDGDDVYVYKDANEPYLVKIYNEDYKVGRQPGDIISYSAFVKSYPVFFWRDPFGRLIRFTNRSFIPLAECAKPVIYLYPTKKTAISVNFGSEVRLTKTVPQIGKKGWSVEADPDGLIRDLSDSETYPYLFWEGTGLVYNSPEKGFVVAREGLSKFFDDKLFKLGLNDKEISDFKEYWLPLMQDKPFYKVGFWGTNVVNQLAPLEVIPTPDTVIRILMDFEGLDKPVSLVEPELTAVPRNGFTLIEWGGVKK